MSFESSFTTLRPLHAYHEAHDTSLDAFGRDVTLALQNCVPTGIKPYERVETLFVSWKDEDQKCTEELLDVSEVFRSRGYQTRHIYLPSSSPLTFLLKSIIDWRGGGKSILKIFFYSGHGEGGSNGQCILRANLSDLSPKVDFSSARDVLKELDQDILLIMNCCWAATAALESMELLAASAVGVEAAGPANPRSFPKAIMAGMKLLGDEAFTVASLHAVLMKFCNKLMSTPIYVQKENAEDGPIILPKFTSDVIKLPGYMGWIIEDDGAKERRTTNIRLSQDSPFHQSSFAKRVL